MGMLVRLLPAPPTLRRAGGVGVTVARRVVTLAVAVAHHRREVVDEAPRRLAPAVGAQAKAAVLTRDDVAARDELRDCRTHLVDREGEEARQAAERRVLLGEAFALQPEEQLEHFITQRDLAPRFTSRVVSHATAAPASAARPPPRASGAPRAARQGQTRRVRSTAPRR